MNDVIILYTPRHTGTHFVRMLLESHPSVSTAIGEDYFIDAQLRPGYVLAGRGMGWQDDAVRPGADRSSERMLRDYFHDYLKGTINYEAFRQSLRYWRTISAERKLPRTHKEHTLLQVGQEFAELGIHLEPKLERYLLFRCHSHPEHQSAELSRLTSECRVITTVRHPLFSILTILRREASSDHEAVIQGFLAELHCTFGLRGCFAFCTDLWQPDRARLAGVLDFLDLPRSAATDRYLDLRPRINGTVAKGEPHGQHNYCLEYPHSPEFLASLDDAKRALADDALHPLLAPYWARIKDAGLIPRYETLGYNFNGY